MVIRLTRTYFPDGTNGKLTCDGTFISYAIELPWKMNERRVSCIPEGEYFIEKRYSRKFKSHLNVKDVEDRDLILIHPANNALLELDGCIAPVTKLSGPGLGLQSRIAFKKLMDLVSKAIERGEDVLLIVES
jgi:hypothetical protein